MFVWWQEFFLAEPLAVRESTNDLCLVVELGNPSLLKGLSLLVASLRARFGDLHQGYLLNCQHSKNIGLLVYRPKKHEPQKAQREITEC